MPEIMVDVPGRGVFLSNYLTYRPIGGDGEWQFHKDRGIRSEKVPESRLGRYGVPVGKAVVDISDADVERIADRIDSIWANDGAMSLRTAVKQALREGTGTT